MAAYTFLGANGLELVASEVDAVVRTFGLAAGDVSETEFAAWLEANTEKSK